MKQILDTSIIAATAALCVFAAACSDEPEPQPPPQPMPTQTAPPVPVPTQTAPPPPTVQAGPCDGTMNGAMQVAIKAREKAELGWGMKSAGFACQVVEEGGKTTVAITLQPGKCYTFLASSFPNVTELNLFLKPNLSSGNGEGLTAMAPALAQDSEQGLTASIGKGKSCYKNAAPFPVAAVVQAVAQSGSGPIAVQAYER